MRILVTGGLGFMGSNFVHHMLTTYPDCSVLNFDKMTYAGNPENLIITALLEPVAGGVLAFLLLGEVLEPPQLLGGALVIGAIADQFDFTVGDKVKGNLANAFLIVTPLVFIGATVLIRGRHHVATDLERARTVTASQI